MENKGAWHKYSDSKPQENKFYLVHIKKEEIPGLFLEGFPITIAKYNTVSRDWTLHGNLLAPPLAENAVIEWHELPHLNSTAV